MIFLSKKKKRLTMQIESNKDMSSNSEKEQKFSVLNISTSNRQSF